MKKRERSCLFAAALAATLLGCGPQAQPPPAAAAAPVTDSTLSANRDRLLASLGQVPGGQFYGLSGACSVWRAMDQSQRYEFLMFTDSFGQRSPLYNDWSGGPSIAHVNRLLWVWGTCPAGTHWVKGPGTDGYCYYNGSNAYQGHHECGTESANRIFAELDDTLMPLVRDEYAGLPTWGNCEDDPHKGFNACTEQHMPGGLNYQVDAGGQLQYYEWPWDPDGCVGGRTLWNRLWYERNLGFANNGAPYGCYGAAYAPSWAKGVVEFDVDFDLTHESSTTCYYGDGYYGITKYATGWNNLVTYNDMDLDYNPCTSPAVNGATYCVDAPDNSMVSLSCPAGQVISRITFASYGQPDTYTCGAYWPAWCSSASTLGVVESSCVSRQSCTIPVTAATFGDPCFGVVKKLGVQYTCDVPPTNVLTMQRWGTQQGGWQDQMLWVAGDFTGDGKADMASILIDWGELAVDVHRNTGSAFTLERWGTQLNGWQDQQKLLTGDFNGDGRLDLAVIWNDVYYGQNAVVDVYLNTGAGFEVQTWAYYPGAWWDWAWVAGDFNGDGKTDIATVWADAYNRLYVDVNVSTGGYFVQQRWATQQGTWVSGMQWLAGDFNGDGKADLASVFPEAGNASIDVRPSSGYGFGWQRWATQQGGWVSGKWLSGDFDGDGKADLAKVWRDGGLADIDVHLSTGAGFSMQRWATWQGGYWDAQQWVVGDFNGDRKADFAKAFNDAGGADLDVHLH